MNDAFEIMSSLFELMPQPFAMHCAIGHVCYSFCHCIDSVIYSAIHVATDSAVYYVIHLEYHSPIHSTIRLVIHPTIHYDAIH